MRGGVLRDYRALFTWKRPAGWRVTLGQDAREVWGDEARLEIEEPGFGVHGVLNARESWATLEEEHDELASAFLAEAEGTRGTAARLQLGSVPALETTISSANGDLPFAYRLITAQSGGLSYELVFMGLPGNLAAASASIAGAAGAFAFGAELDPPRVRGNVYRDEKLGFTLARPGYGWKAHLGLVPGDAGRSSGSCLWKHPDGREVFSIAIGIPNTVADERVLEDVVLTGIERDQGVPPEDSTGTLAGLPARRKSFRSADRRLEIWVVRRENSLFFLGSGCDSSRCTPEDAERVFSFLP
jgi:hypothetical protein